MKQDQRVRLSLRKAHEDQGTHETPQEIGDMGHPAFVEGQEGNSRSLRFLFWGFR
jgi:hypothetical protein